MASERHCRSFFDFGPQNRLSFSSFVPERRTHWVPFGHLHSQKICECLWKFLFMSQFCNTWLFYCRGYYRCTHRHAQGCLATKQVQKSDEDPTIFEVTYRGRHTCSQASQLAVASSSVASERSKENKNHYQPQKLPSQEIVFNFGGGLKSEDLETREDDIFPSFSFPSTPIGSQNADNNIFSETMLELENNFMGSFSPTFISPATSESNLFPMSPCHMNNYGLGLIVQTSESDLTAEIISAPTSVTNSPIGNWDFSLDKVEIDPNFPFDNPEFFS